MPRPPTLKILLQLYQIYCDGADLVNCIHSSNFSLATTVPHLQYHFTAHLWVSLWVLRQRTPAPWLLTYLLTRHGRDFRHSPHPRSVVTSWFPIRLVDGWNLWSAFRAFSVEMFLRWWHWHVNIVGSLGPLQLWALMAGQSMTPRVNWIWSCLLTSLLSESQWDSCSWFSYLTVSLVGTGQLTSLLGVTSLP